MKVTLSVNDVGRINPEEITMNFQEDSYKVTILQQERIGAETVAPHSQGFKRQLSKI